MSNVAQVVKGTPAIDGAGVHLTRVLGRANVVDFDPFLMLDSFDSTNPSDYTAGFPRHPHRGIETLTYFIHGEMVHKDTLGNSGTIRDGQAQWMTAGSGIEHAEMPQPVNRILGIQLWINLPREDKMTTPKYFDVTEKDIGEITFDGGRGRVVAGNYNGVQGAKGHHLDISFFDFDLENDTSLTIDRKDGENAFLFTILGQVNIDGQAYSEKSAILLTPGNQITLKAHQGPARVFFLQGPKLQEPVAWAGPIVMNTREELDQASLDIRQGTFVQNQAWIDE